MNILSISNYSLNNQKNLFLNKENNNSALSKFGITMPKQLVQDTVSFKATPKVANKSWEVTLELATDIHNEMKVLSEKVKRFMHTNFNDLVASDRYPDNPIRKICMRVKSPYSIQAKTGSRKWTSKEEIKSYMTDIIGVKFVIGEPNKYIVDTILDRFIPLIKSRKIELLEIENKRLNYLCTERPEEQAKYDYASMSMMKKMIGIQNDVWNGNGKVKNPKTVSYNLEDYQESNYCATHFLFRIPGKEPLTFELQLIGEDVNNAKYVDDLLFKWLNGKRVEDKYNPVKKIMAPLIDPNFFKDEDPEYAEKIVEQAREIYNQYRADVFLFQRKRDPDLYTGKSKKISFLPMQQRLFPPEIERKYGIKSSDFEFDNLYEQIQKCEKKAEISTKNLEKAWAVQAERKQMSKKQAKKYK